MMSHSNEIQSECDGDGNSSFEDHIQSDLDVIFIVM